MKESGHSQRVANVVISEQSTGKGKENNITSSSKPSMMRRQKSSPNAPFPTEHQKKFSERKREAFRKSRTHLPSSTMSRDSFFLRHELPKFRPALRAGNKDMIRGQEDKRVFLVYLPSTVTIESPKTQAYGYEVLWKKKTDSTATAKVNCVKNKTQKRQQQLTSNDQTDDHHSQNGNTPKTNINTVNTKTGSKTKSASKRTAANAAAARSSELFQNFSAVHQLKTPVTVNLASKLEEILNLFQCDAMWHELQHAPTDSILKKDEQRRTFEAMQASIKGNRKKHKIEKVVQDLQAQINILQRKVALNANRTTSTERGNAPNDHEQQNQATNTGKHQSRNDKKIESITPEGKQISDWGDGQQSGEQGLPPPEENFDEENKTISAELQQETTKKNDDGGAEEEGKQKRSTKNKTNLKTALQEDGGNKIEYNSDSSFDSDDTVNVELCRSAYENSIKVSLEDCIDEALTDCGDSSSSHNESEGLSYNYHRANLTDNHNNVINTSGIDADSITNAGYANDKGTTAKYSNSSNSQYHGKKNKGNNKSGRRNSTSIDRRPVQYYMVVFACSIRCEALLNTLKAHGIGIKYGTVMTFPLTTFRSSFDSAKERRRYIEGSTFTKTTSFGDDGDGILGASPYSNSFGLPRNGNGFTGGGKDELNIWGLVPNFSHTVSSRLIVDEHIDQVTHDACFTFDYLILLIVASALSAVGLAIDSSTIIVASMLVSPLMGPIVAMTFGSVIGSRSMFLLGLMSECIGFLVCFGVGFIFGTGFIPWANAAEWYDWPTYEMISRGTPSGILTSLMIAIPSGFGVGISVLSVGSSFASLIGVAISAALLPPIVNSGMMFAVSLLWTPITGRTTRNCRNVDNIDHTFDVIDLCERSSDAYIVFALSLSNSIINVICIYLTAYLIFWIKQVKVVQTNPTMDSISSDNWIKNAYNNYLNPNAAASIVASLRRLQQEKKKEEEEEQLSQEEEEGQQQQKAAELVPGKKKKNGTKKSFFDKTSASSSMMKEDNDTKKKKKKKKLTMVNNREGGSDKDTTIQIKTTTTDRNTTATTDNDSDLRPSQRRRRNRLLRAFSSSSAGSLPSRRRCDRDQRELRQHERFRSEGGSSFFNFRGHGSPRRQRSSGPLSNLQYNSDDDENLRKERVASVRMADWAIENTLLSPQQTGHTISHLISTARDHIRSVPSWHSPTALQTQHSTESSIGEGHRYSGEMEIDGERSRERRGSRRVALKDLFKSWQPKGD
eukprot:g3834.t1